MRNKLGQFIKGTIPYNKRIYIKKVCKCGKEFFVKPSLERIKFCSHGCAKEVKLKNLTHRFNKGSKPWNKGMIGFLSGEKHYNWTGGKYGENYRERRRIQGRLQKLVFKRDNWTCQICNKRGGVLHVDHIQSFAEYLEGRFDINNCRTLCVSCHYCITFKKTMPKNSRWGTIFMKKEVD